MATSPSDATNRNILAWLDRLQASVRAGSPGDATAANFASSASASLADAKTPTFNSTSFSSTNPNFASNPAFEESDEDEVGNEGEGEEEDNGDGESSTALPDASVPLGLIANLSLSNSYKRRTGEAPTREDELDELDDDNVVRTFFFRLSSQI